MSEYIVCVDDLEESYHRYADIKPETVFGHRLREEIVRCRDCKHYSDSEFIVATDVEHVCHFWHGKPTKVEADGYCKWGVPRDRGELLPFPFCGNEINGDTSDGYHTFNELYHHRAVLFSVVVAANSGKAWKSKLHHDGTMYDGMFIVGIETPQGQATYHYDLEYWDIFWCKELERAPEWDGHTSDDAIERIGSLRYVVFEGLRGRR